EYTIISHVQSSNGGLAEGLIINGRRFYIPENIIQALKSLVDHGAFPAINSPVRLWIEDMCVNRGSAEEKAYMQSVMPEVNVKSTYNVCYLGSIGTFFGGSRLLYKHAASLSPGTQCLASWEAIFTSLHEFNENRVEIPA